MRIARVFVSCFLYCCCFFLPANARSDYQNLSAKIEAANRIRNDAVAIDSLFHIIREYRLLPQDDLAAKNNLVFRLSASQRFDESLKLCHDNISLSRKLQRDSAECVYTKLLGITYYFMKQNRQAKVWFEKALAMAEQKGYHQIIYSCSNNIGGILIDEKDYAGAEKPLLRALELMNQHGAKKEELFITRRLLATLYDYQGKPRAAEDMYKATINASLAEKDSIYAAYAMTFYADLLWKQQQYAKAIATGQKAIEIERRNSDKNALLTSLILQRKYIIGQRDFKELASLDSEIIAEQKLLFSTDLNKEISETEVKYKTAEIVYQKQLGELAAKKKQQLTMVVFTGVILLGTLLFVIVYQRNRARQQSQLEAEKTKAIIMGEEQERLRMARELHDGVGQMMSAAKMNLSALEQPLQLPDEATARKYQQVISLVDTSCAELRNIAHNLAPYSVQQLGFANALRNLVQKIDQEKLAINLFMDPLPEPLDEVRASTLFRVIQECINNVLKHADAHNLDIAVICEKERLSVSIEDDGKGFDTQDTDSSAGIGMENIRKRIRYLDGTVEWDSAPGKGTLVAISIPLKM